MPIKYLSSFTVADTTIRFPLDDATGRVGLELLPTALLGKTVPRRTTLRGQPYIDSMPGARDMPAVVLDALVQVKLIGDSYPDGLSQGHTMRNSPSVDAFKYDRQEVRHDGEKTTVVTMFKSAAGQRLEHRLSWHEGDAAVEIATVFFNDSPLPATLEMLSSFSLGGITPFDAADAPGRLRVHRFRSWWAAEGRLETRSIEDLHLERSWTGFGMFNERFGQVGSMPVRKWFPFVAVEDTQAGVVWGAQLAWAGSWQLEIFRRHDDVCLSGGLADREFGHWLKTLAPGASFTTPPAIVACAQGDLDSLCDRLTAVQHRAADTQPSIEQDLPIVFNEWCTTWGDPSHEKIAAIARRLKGSPIKYLVIDAGWYKSGNVNWSNAQGDWIPSTKLFPKGLEAVAAEIRAQGLIPGLWFEMETVGEMSAAFSRVEHVLKRDGLPLTVRSRRFWDMNDPQTVDYLTERVIGLLERCGFGYLKVDYNETIGLGCDGAESLGEGLRRNVEGVYRFFERIRARLPDLVIENCSAGGHRLEPSMLARSAMSSFSDAHELPEIPIIAANLNQLVLPRQAQIWAVLRKTDSPRRLAYSLAATFLGRMCLSGDVTDLSDAQWQLTLQAQQLYRRIAPLIKHGSSRRYGQPGTSWRHPQGGQAVVRTAADGKSTLAVLHAFAQPPAQVTIPLRKAKDWRVVNSFPDESVPPITVKPNALILPIEAEFSARVLLLERT